MKVFACECASHVQTVSELLIDLCCMWDRMFRIFLVLGLDITRVGVPTLFQLDTCYVYLELVNACVYSALSDGVCEGAPLLLVIEDLDVMFDCQFQS